MESSESSGARRVRRGRSARTARRRARPVSRGRPLLCAAFASVAVVGATAAGTVYVKAQAHTGKGALSSSATPSASREASVETVAEPTVDYDVLLAEAMQSMGVEDGTEVSVSVLDPASGDSASYGEGAFVTASIVKVDILATLLLQAQDADRHLTAAEKTYATAMIENSDNASASALWRIIGEADGLDAANERFGLKETEGGDGLLWGLTRTTAADQLTLLQQVFGDDTELSEASRTYLRGLMGQVAADQHWGVSAAADGSGWALKNGWLPRSTTGLWVINSIGRVTADGHDYLAAVLSHGNSTKAKGISLVETAARAAVSVFAGETVSASRSPSLSASQSATG
ncbi:serine hydrolase [Streptomyces luteolifulvus]|uniref:Serine hydrolase n=1 Tax=Streptomyces luteolifulvus TaxID=2615112 RepID=A0A6H9VAF8_9ACTN|nr:serine hydrolase [Streptomyces luteolifulvus]KAB1150632.1 serine hydrolase [Streptomyces luteolifulvus]